MNFFTVVGVWSVTFHTTVGGTIKKSIGTSATTGTGSPMPSFNGSLFAIGKISHITFTSSDLGAFIALDDFKAEINCFAAGTLIETTTGPRAVETLVNGDMLRRADGGITKVNWLGTQDVNTRFTNPKKVNPICITAGALGNGMPLRDLKISPDHAIAIDGVLINASALVNGTSIYQIATMPREGFIYYHVETDAHELLLAKGVAAETFIDYSGRDSFENGDEVTGRVAEMAMPRISSRRLMPSELQARLNENTQSRSVA